MEFGLMLLAQASITALVVLGVLAGFWFKVVRPYLDRKVEELIEASREIEPGVTRGVKAGVAETLRELPESTVKESTRQFLKFGSGLFENGLSSFLGSAADLERQSRGNGADQRPD
ncbi:hypothetical protein MARLIPOL_07759 [Marinobacter lipolyticus SM19]|uniref:Uncharacterized protein n=1 Tax=Marinobacter lipolyticus SM19 TaxID=1318628 RepID=R8B214_9GAMM|nr:hypothetical protein [Marinobacter lipolyticus]EON92631.1 hypothetical protein MARLIPOL_07759 [Marinobacter lipolyticus SM19]